MSKATILLITLAALGLGSLIGASLVDNEPAPSVTSEPETIDETPVTASVSRGGAPLFRYYGPDNVSVKYDDFGRAEPSTIGENFIGREGDYKSETVTIKLEADAGTEYKALMQQGDAIVYSWKTDGGMVYYDFHAHDESFGEEFFTRYAEGEGVADSGMIAAPYAGQHGWYLLNLEGEPLTVTLNVAGFYDEIIEIEVESY